MILGVGLDVVHVERLRRWYEIDGLLRRFFHPSELDAALARGEAGVLSLAARFAAKEAFGKALGAGLRGFSLREIAVMNEPTGKPVMHLRGRALQALKAMGGKRVFVSLTHEPAYALAVVVVEGD